MKFKQNITATEKDSKILQHRGLKLLLVLLIVPLITSCEILNEPQTVQTKPTNSPIVIQERPPKIQDPEFDEAITILTFETVYNEYFRDSFKQEIMSVLRSEGASDKEAESRALQFVDEMDKDVELNKGKFVYYGFAEDPYLTFATWLKSTLSYIKEQNSIIEYYEDIAKERSKNNTEDDNNDD